MALWDLKIKGTKENKLPLELFDLLKSLNDKGILDFSFVEFYNDKIIYEEDYMGIIEEYTFDSSNLHVIASIDKAENEFVFGIGTGCMMMDYIAITKDNEKELMDLYDKIKELSANYSYNS